MPVLFFTSLLAAYTYFNVGQYILQ